MSKTLRRVYLNSESICHAALANRLRTEKNMEFISGERIPFVILYDIIKSH